MVGGLTGCGSSQGPVGPTTSTTTLPPPPTVVHDDTFAGRIELRPVDLTEAQLPTSSTSCAR